MYKIFSFILFLMFSLNIFAQNLVPNPSFEEYYSCPDGISQIDSAIGWKQYRPTVDFFHSCSSYPNISVPYQVENYQCAATGNAFCGFWAYNSTISNLREYVGRQLSTLLIPGQKYYVNFKVNLGWSAKCGINNLGVLFSTIPYNSSNWAPITNFAHIFTPLIIIDTTNWINISGSFLADSMYQYIIIGNFFDDINTDTINLDTSNICLAYYFVDDVCVSNDSITCIDIKEQIINFSADSTTIQEGSYINFNVNTVVDYDLYEWQFDGATPNTSNDSLPSNIYYDIPGIYTVTLIVSDSNGCRDTITKINYITVIQNTTIYEKNLLNNIIIYPNPTNGKIFIKFAKDYVFNVELYNLLGKLVYKKENLCAQSNKIDLSKFLDGIYLIKLQTKDKILTRKILLIR